MCVSSNCNDVYKLVNTLVHNLYDDKEASMKSDVCTGKKKYYWVHTFDKLPSPPMITFAYTVDI